MKKLLNILFLSTFILSSQAQSIMIDNHKAMDLGLSVKWATANLGAASSSSLGGYYIWGHQQKYTGETYKLDETLGYKGEGNMKLSDDAARAAWGGSWRIPTKEECQELIDRCSWQFVKSKNAKGVTYEGYNVTGPNGNKIFIPIPVCRCRDYCYCVYMYMTSSYEFTYTVGPALMDYRMTINEDNDIRIESYGHGFPYFVRPVTDASPSEPEEDSKIYTIVETPASFPGGEPALLNYINSHLKYPATAMQQDIQGKVVLKFVILENGSIGDIQVVESLESHCDQEAIRVVKNLPRFYPGKQMGKPVKSWFTLPFRFQLM